MVNELSEEERLAFCEDRYEAILSFSSENPENLAVGFENSCKLAGLLEGMDVASCEAAQTGCLGESTEPNRDQYIESCLAEEQFFAECMAPANEFVTCENDSLRHVFNAFAMLDLSAYSCEDAGDLTKLMELFALLGGVLPPDDICTPAATACTEIGAQ